MIVIVSILTAFAVWQVLLHFGVFEASKGQSVLVEDIKTERNLNKKRRIEKRKLSFYYDVADTFRALMLSEYTYNRHKYFIERLDIRSEPLDRQLQPEELRGKYVLIFGIGLFCIPLGIFFPIIWLVSIVCVVIFASYGIFLNQKIEDEDRIIDDYFLDMYLLMYSKLRLGSKARLQTVVESYLDTLETAQNLQMKAVMSKLAQFLLNNLTLYEDHVAVPKLRDRYKSATIVNFCNVASQALQGIDNSDNLLTFKMALVRRKTAMMEERAAKLCRAGERSIYAIYVILFIFIAVGWASKLPTGMM